MTTDSLGRHAARGARDLMIGQALRLAVQLIGLVILSRLLEPAQFGIVAVATAIVGFGEALRDFGLTSAAIRSPELTNGQRDILFWASSAIGAVLAVALALLAPLVAGAFRLPELTPALVVLSTVLLLNGISAQYRANLNRTLKFRALAIAETVAPVVSLTAAIVMALAGFGYWALVMQLVATSVVTTILYIALSPWLPRLPRRGTGSRPLLLFGGQVAVSQVLSYAGSNIDTVVLGLVSPASQVGLYNRAFQLVMSPLTQLRVPAQVVSIPALSRVRDDSAQYLRYVLRAQATLGYLVMPMVAVLASASLPIVTLALGDQWTGAAPIVTILSIAGALQLLASVANWIFTVSGMGRAIQQYAVFSLVIKAACVCALAWLGAIGVAAGYAVAVVIAWPVALGWALRGAGLDWKPVFAQSARMVGLGALAAGAAAAIVSIVPAWEPGFQLVISLGVVTVVFASGLVVPAVRRDMFSVARALHLSISRR